MPLPTKVVPGQAEPLRFPYPLPLELSSAVFLRGPEVPPGCGETELAQPHRALFDTCGEPLADMVTHLIHFLSSPLYSESHLERIREAPLPLMWRPHPLPAL